MSAVIEMRNAEVRVIENQFGYQFVRIQFMDKTVDVPVSQSMAHTLELVLIQKRALAVT